MNAPIPFRAHHFLCAIGLEGRGYSDTFTKNMADIVDGQLRAAGGDDIVLEVVGQADAICGPCPKRIGTGCLANRKITKLDTRHGQALGLEPGDQLSWGDAKALIASNIAPDDLDHLCSGCQWLPMGMCKTAVQRLIKGR